MRTITAGLMLLITTSSIAFAESSPLGTVPELSGAIYANNVPEHIRTSPSSANLFVEEDRRKAKEQAKKQTKKKR